MEDPTRHVYSRDLDVVMEENNNIHEGKSYLDQVLEPTSLNFLRNTKTTPTNMNGYTTTTTTTTTNTITTTASSSSSTSNGRLHSLPQRRARAGTMPSMMSFDSILSSSSSQPPLLRTATHNHAILNNSIMTTTTEQPFTSSSPLLSTTPTSTPPPPIMTPVGGGRHRSGSLNLPLPSLSFDTSPSLFWSGTTTTTTTTNATTNTPGSMSHGNNTPSPPSPATEQLLQGDDDFSIARTMRSLGLEDDANSSSTTVLDEEELINQCRASLLASASNTTTRNRSYSVNATVRYDPPPLPSTTGNSHFPIRGRSNTVSKPSFNSLQHLSHLNHYQHLLDPFSSTSSSQQQQQPQQRTRSTSFGQASSPPSFHGISRPPLPPHSIHNTNGTSSSSSSSASSTSSLWQMHRPLTPVIGEEENMSLGDSELLANMVYDPLAQQQQQQQQQDSIYKQDQSETTFIEPYMHLSQSTPTSLRSSLPSSTTTATTTMPVAATASRSLWIGNIDASITAETLTMAFSPYGPIESVRLLMEKECAFVNYYHVEHAIRAKEDILGPLAGRVGHCIVRIGYGRTSDPSSPPSPPPPPATTSVPSVTNHTDNTTTTTSTMTSQQDHLTHQATRALWLGNIPSGATPSMLEKVFGNYGTIESIRILSHKTCAFVNFDTIASASAAQEAFLQHHIHSSTFTNVRIGFAKVPPPTTSSSTTTNNNNSTISSPKHLTSSTSSTTCNNNNKYTTSNRRMKEESTNQDTLRDLWQYMEMFGCTSNDKVMIQGLQTCSNYADTIPHVPEFGPQRQLDANRLRDIRKKLDNATSASVCDGYAMECMDEIAELCSDYIGNTVMQRFYDKCSEDMKLSMLEKIAPHLAAIGIHKNGTWAAQKILDTIKTPAQCELVRKYVKSYVPCLMLDQFGNYVVQCCLRLGEQENQFVFEAMVENCQLIGQGRFGARAMRGILESQHITARQQAMIASSLLQHAVFLSTNANGALLLAWLIDTYSIHLMENKKEEEGSPVLRMLALQLIPSLASVAMHKLGSQVVLKLINQSYDKEAQDTILSGLVTDTTLHALFLTSYDTPNNNNNNNRGVQFFQKVIYSTHLSQAEQQVLCARARSILMDDALDHPIHPVRQAFLDELNVVVKA
ncbi:uncharacterized protein BX664DRAFT_295693 [Halteromyces radiatus]|uniref:uncharacterized protein n=1 Tax=Halteromyces radiatus TaxID=101107 RepID=UPI002220BE31|nr:uncharacterized protein BX664DRAFT_295693 [Halteromyces radiatus]KAI8093782.1 hypothetical protein BX664DRAFT_295693 [Halteromyces radiatus]